MKKRKVLIVLICIAIILLAVLFDAVAQATGVQQTEQQGSWIGLVSMLVAAFTATQNHQKSGQITALNTKVDAITADNATIRERIAKLETNGRNN